MLKRAVAAGLALLLAGALGCARKKKQDDQTLFLPANERYERGLRSIQQKNLRNATSMLSRIDYQFGEDRAMLEPLVRLALADATFYQGNDLALIDARALYLDFVTLYGDHEMAPYAQFQAGICSMSQVGHPSRDQTQTHAAIADLRTVETRYPDSHYAAAARMMRRTAEEKLVEHELLVGRFYLKKKAWLAAIERFRGALAQYPAYAHRDQIYLAMGEAYLRIGDPEQARFYMDMVLNDFPDTDSAVAAAKLVAELPEGASENGRRASQ